MAGLHFGKSRWDEIPQVLGLTVDDGGVMSGHWQGMSVHAYFSSRQDKYETINHRTDLGMPFDPPLGVQGLESAELWTLLVDPRRSADVEASATGLETSAASIGDGGISGTVRGRPTKVCLGYHEGAFTTRVEIAVPVPTGCELSLRLPGSLRN